ncbi:hypothetical protein F2Q68_00020995 [Brassica cretica]|uniref:Uncharacterized protein n=1 Tax=Brassica cretica TaxID=69181 RepID=A0A8S9FQK1_BRACR|nr:hypothetical protein F2Q68_00020995 [Brassica cretica]
MQLFSNPPLEATTFLPPDLFDGDDQYSRGGAELGLEKRILWWMASIQSQSLVTTKLEATTSASCSHGGEDDLDQRPRVTEADDEKRRRSFAMECGRGLETTTGALGLVFTQRRGLTSARA